METISTYQEILDLIDTKYQADEFISQLNKLVNELYVKETNVIEKARILLPSPKNDKILALIQQRNISLNDTVAIQSLLLELKDVVLSIPIVNITIPFEVREVHLKRLSAWFTVNCKTKMLAKITLDKSLVGGATIGFKGIYKDYSFSKVLQEKYEKGELNDYVKAK